MPTASHANSALQPARVGSAWLPPYVLPGLFVAAILALLWHVHRHEREIEFNNLRRDTRLAELAVPRKMLTHQEFSDRPADTLSSGMTSETLGEQIDIYLRQNPQLLNTIWTGDDGTGV